MDDLRSAIESAVAEQEPPQADPPPPVVSAEPAVEPSAPAETPPSVGDGAQAEVPAERGSPDVPKSIEEVAGEKPADKPADKGVPDPRIDRAPQSWKGDAKKVWAELPLNVRQEVVRRERETTRVMQETAEVRRGAEGVRDIITPHMDRINSMYGGDANMAINNLLNVERTLVNGDPVAKVNLVAGMIKHFGIDLVALDKALVGQPMPQEVQQQSALERMLEQKLSPIQQFIASQQQRDQQRRQQVEQEVAHTVETMATDPQFPYFDDVRADMADIIEMGAKRGVAISLEQAYSRAVRMNDETYQATTVRESSQAATQAALQAHQAAQRAKGAAVSVSGSPSMPGGNQGNPNDLRGTIAELLGETGSRM